MTVALDWGSFGEESADLPSGPLVFHRGGSGRPLVWLHSAGGPRLSPVVRRLSERHEIFLPTVPGFDGTDRHSGIDDITALAELAAAFIRGRFDAPVDLLGESFGGWIAMRLALANPDLVDHLVLGAPAGLHERDLAIVPTIFAIPETAPEPGPHQAANGAAYASYGGGRIDPDLEANLGRIAAPTLVLIGTADEMTPVSSAQKVRASVPGCRLTYIYGAGHGMDFDQPDRVARVVSDFLERGEAFLVPQA